MIKVNIEKKMGHGPGSFTLKVNSVFPLNEVTRVLGPSGAGKSTLLKILAGLVLPDAGLIKFEDDIWFNAENNYAKKVQERGIGFVFQDYALFPNMTVEQQLSYGTDDANYTNDLLELGELTLFKTRYPKQLSGGQQQRLAILRALSTKPKLLLMDEPFAALDLALKNRIMEKLRLLFHEQKTTVVIVTHQDKEWIEADSHIFYLSSTEN